jgi:dTDP-4-amino-4,6-dideoxygalactose transaminase
MSAITDRAVRVSAASGGASSSAATPPAVPMLDVNRGNAPLREQMLEAVAEVIDSGRFLMGPQVGQLEQQVAELCQAGHAIGCASGSDALLLALMALDIGPGDEVIVPSFTFFATASCVWRLGAKIVFADIDPRTYCLDPAAVEPLITPATRAIIPVHLFGQSANMPAICELACARSIAVIEDAAQAIGGAYQGRAVGSWGLMTALSFYPTKNLGGCGDGGMLVCDDPQLAERLRRLANHGMHPRYHHPEVGINSRLDTIQAALLGVKLNQLGNYVQQRQAHADRYRELFRAADVPAVVELPYHDPAAYHVWNQFGIRVLGGQRDALREHLHSQGIGCEIYYPIPLHLQACFTACGYSAGTLPKTEQAAREILHLPIYPELTVSEQLRVVESIQGFYRQSGLRRAA